MKGFLVLENGQKFSGELLSGEETVGEVVFTTGMTGYQEILTDPSYCGQLIVLTYPLIANYGIASENEQAKIPYAKGLIVDELCETPSNWQNEGDLKTYLRAHHIPCLYNVDTRAVTRAIRQSGVMKGCIVAATASPEEIDKKLKEKLETNVIEKVSTKKIVYRGKGKYRIAVIDYGVKENILKELLLRDCSLVIFPSTTKAVNILAENPDAIFLSNGPGDPKENLAAILEVKKMLGVKPIFGVCMGQQALALALGADTYKLKFGHRGSNHPVKDIRTNRVYITSQNHGYAIDEKTLPKNITITHISDNDGTVEGFEDKELKVKSVQYHPEAGPGPADNLYLFDEFITMIKENKKC